MTNLIEQLEKTNYHFRIHAFILVGIILCGQSQETFARIDISETQSEGKVSTPPLPVEPSFCSTGVTWTDNNCLIGPVSINVDISPKVFDQLCPISSSRGKKAAPTTCDLYMICHDESLTVNQCPPGNNFHPIEKQCVDSHLFECSHPVLKDPKSLLKEKNEDAEFKRDISEWEGHLVSSEFNFDQNWKSSWCQNGEEGIFAHPYSCEYFIQCGSGKFFEQKCPTGTLFNSRLSICDWKQNVECHIRKRRDLLSYPMLTSKSKAQEIHVIQRRSPCKDDFISRHPQFCNKFQICSNGRIHTQECGQGTVFDPLKKVCASPDTVDCKSTIRDFGTYDCQKDMKYIASHPEDCTKFLECENERIHVKSCPTSTKFNVETSSCDFSYKTTCKPLISLEHDIDINYLSTKPTRLRRDLSQYECEFNYIAPLDGFCNQFIECENKRLFKKSCGPGTAYNPLLGQCDWPYNVRSQDTQYCGKYLQCDGRKFVSKNCPQNLYYNVETGKCDAIEHVNCAGKQDDPRRNDNYLQS